MRILKCSVCGSVKVSCIINGISYCSRCGSKVVLTNMVKFLQNLKKEGLIPSAVEIPEV